MDNPKYYTSEHVSKEYEKLTLRGKIGVLMEALDYMQQFNGRTRFYCIAMAMGYQNHEGEGDTYFKRNEQ